MDREKDDTSNEINVGENAGADEATGPVYNNNFDADTGVHNNDPLEKRSYANEQDDGKCMELKAKSNNGELQETDRISMNRNTQSTPTEANTSLNEKENAERTMESPDSDAIVVADSNVTQGGKMVKEDVQDALPIDDEKNNVTADTGGSCACMDDERTKKENEKHLIIERQDKDKGSVPSSTSHTDNQMSKKQKHTEDAVGELQDERALDSTRSVVDEDIVKSVSSGNKSIMLDRENEISGNNQGNADDRETGDQQTDQKAKKKRKKSKSKQKDAQKTYFEQVTNQGTNDHETNSTNSCSLKDYVVVTDKEAYEVKDKDVKAMRAETDKLRQERNQLKRAVDGIRAVIEEKILRSEKGIQDVETKQAGTRRRANTGPSTSYAEKDMVMEIETLLSLERERFELEKRKKQSDVEHKLETAKNILKEKEKEMKTLKRQKEEEIKTLKQQVNILTETHTKLQKDLARKQAEYDDQVLANQELTVKDVNLQKQHMTLQSQLKEHAETINYLVTQNQGLWSTNEQLKSNSRENFHAMQTLKCDVDRLQTQNAVLRKNLETIEEEKSTLNLRLSKLAGAHLTRDNPNIADLSDENRPTKIAEKFSELYDNEWTDAFEELSDKWELDERESVDKMIRLLKVVDRECSFYSRPHREVLDDLQRVTVKLDRLSSKNKTTKTAVITGCEKESSCQSNGGTLDETDPSHRGTKHTDPGKVYSNTIHKNIHEQKDEAKSQEINDKKEILERTDEADTDSPPTKETAERAQNENELTDDADGRMDNDKNGKGNAKEDNQKATTHTRKNNGQESPIENMTDEYLEGQIKASHFKKRRSSAEIPPKSDGKENDEPGLDRSNEIDKVRHQDTQNLKERNVTENVHTENRETDQELTNDNKELDEDVGLSKTAEDRNLGSNHSDMLSLAEENDGREEIAGSKEEGQRELTREKQSTIEEIGYKENIDFDKRENETENEINRNNTSTLIYKREHSNKTNNATSDVKLLNGIEDGDGLGITFTLEQSINHVEGETTVEEGEAGTNDEQHGWVDKGEEVEEELGDEDRHEYGYNEDNDNVERKDVVADTVENKNIPEKFSTCVDTGEVAAVLKIEVEFTAEQKKTVSDIKRLCTAKLEKSQKISEVIAQKVAFEVNHEYLQNPTVMAFIQKCAELCWFMVIQEPPVVVGFETETENVKFDKDRYKAYTKTGKKLDFVVWPPLYLHKDGAMLCKGTAQGKD